MKPYTLKEKNIIGIKHLGLKIRMAPTFQNGFCLGDGHPNWPLQLYGDIILLRIGSVHVVFLITLQKIITQVFNFSCRK